MVLNMLWKELNPTALNVISALRQAITNLLQSIIYTTWKWPRLDRKRDKNSLNIRLAILSNSKSKEVSLSAEINCIKINIDNWQWMEEVGERPIFQQFVQSTQKESQICFS